MTDLWQQKQFASDYSKNASNADKGWYEYLINFPSMLDMMPKSAERVLDYGCGSGNFTNMLARQFPVVEGADYSQAMIDLATKTYPDLNFFVWDGQKQPPDIEQYDAISSKLTIHLVEDLDTLASNLNLILRPGGTLVLSTTHPMNSAKHVRDYWTAERYETQIKSYDVHFGMIHRSFTDYIMPFLRSGLILNDICETKIPADLVTKYKVPPEKLTAPRCLNLSFIKPASKR